MSPNVARVRELSAIPRVWTDVSVSPAISVVRSNLSNISVNSKVALCSESIPSPVVRSPSLKTKAPNPVSSLKRGPKQALVSPKSA